jgi:ABC-type transporter Mla subunit MlaD
VSDYETTQRTRNIIVGAFVIAALLAFGWLIYKFGDLPRALSKIGTFRVFVQFPTAQGVQQDTPVRLSGYQIGRVTAVKAPEKLRDLHTGLEYHQTVVVLSIDNRYRNVPSNVDVRLMTRGLGSSYIELIVNPALELTPLDPNRPETRFLVDGITLQGSTGVASEFFPPESQKRLDELADSLNQLVVNANDIIGNAQNKENIRVTLANLTESSKQASEALKEFKEFSSTAGAAIKNTQGQIEELMVAAVEASEELSKTSAELRLVLEKINTGQGSAARLINDGRLYENLLENSEQLEVLIEQLNSLVERNKALPIKVK